MSRSNSATERGATWSRSTRNGVSAVLLVLVAGCASSGRSPDIRTPEASLYQRLGGEAGVAAITEDLLVRSAEDPRIRDDFAEADIVNLYERLVEHLCALTGGPCTYSGRDMKAAHAGLALTEADFNALVEHLIDAMTERGVPIAAQNELLAILAPMRGEVIRQ